MKSLEDLVALPHLVVAHRGASGSAPENTLTAIGLALEAGALMIEIDVQITTDEQIVVFHDPSLERTSNGHGEICRSSSAELKKLDAGSWFGERFRGEKIPLLDEVFQLIRGRACINVEIKPPAAGEDWRKRIRLITAATAAAEMTPFTLFSSFHHDSLRYLNSLKQGFHTAALLPSGDQRPVSEVLRDTGCQAFVCSLRQLTPELAADIAAHDIFTGVYTINTGQEAELALQRHARGLVTDFPERILHYLETRAQ
ncbi:MAG: glycerophosphodiester phosphodiesterase family protein [Thermodesulfobacteriota bacterium]